MTICHMLRHFTLCVNVYNRFTKFTVNSFSTNTTLSYHVKLQASHIEIEIEETEPNIFLKNKKIISITSTTIGLDQSSYHSTS